MMDSASAAKALGYHKRALLRRVDALGALVTPHVTEGKNGGFLFDDTAISLLDRLQQLERDGWSVAAAVQHIREEFRSPQQNGDTAAVATAPTSDARTDTDELVKELRSRIREQAETIGWLKNQLESRDEQILALMPGKDSEDATEGNSAPHNGSLSRWQHFKAALLGRT